MTWQNQADLNLLLLGATRPDLYKPFPMACLKHCSWHMLLNINQQKISRLSDQILNLTFCRTFPCNRLKWRRLVGWPVIFIDDFWHGFNVIKSRCYSVV